MQLQRPIKTQAIAIVQRPRERTEEEMLTRLFMIAILVTCGGSVRSQSLGEVAARENERRAKTGRSMKSFTDADLRDAASKRARETVVPTSGEPSSGPAVAPGSSTSTDSSPSEASKKARGAEYKVRLDATNAYLKEAEENLKAAERDWNMVMSHPWQLASSLDGVRSRLEAAKKSVAMLRRQREDIEDAARRESIPPGYLR